MHAIKARKHIMGIDVKLILSLGVKRGVSIKFQPL
jgi:hypothetical protein